MTKEERIKMVKAMEFICRNLNNEEILFDWLCFGVDDGNIEYGDLTTDLNNCDIEPFLEDGDFRDLTELFLSLMSLAKRDGGLLW